MMQNTIWALALSRRKAGLACFSDLHLDDMVLRSLPEDMDSAIKSLIGFINQSIQNRRLEFVALQVPYGKPTERILLLYSVAKDALRAQAVPLVEVELTELLAAYGLPSLQRVEHLRKVGRSIWPSLNDANATTLAMDAAVLGLHVQVDRLFNIYENAPCEDP